MRTDAYFQNYFTKGSFEISQCTHSGLVFFRKKEQRKKKKREKRGRERRKKKKENRKIEKREVLHLD